MSDEKTYPTHRMTFAEKQQDERGRDKLGQPVEVATVWPRKNGKQGGIVDWHIKPEKLGNGVFFLLDNERQNQHAQDQGDAFDRSDAQGSERGQGLER